MRTCLVFGGSGTLGSATCRALAREGAQVTFTWHQNEEAAERLTKELPGARALRCDLREPAQVTQAVADASRDGRIDAVVQAAGAADFRRGAEVDASAFDANLAVNARGTFLACQAAIPFFVAAGGGNLVLLGSLSGTKMVTAPPLLAASMAAIKGIAEGFAKELGMKGIRANVLAPGLVEAGSSLRLSEDLRRSYLQHCALGRFARASEVAEWATWLALKNTYITGQTIVLDGGL